MNEHHYALVVGINRYPGIRDLRAARRDAEDFASWLRDSAGGALPDDADHIIEVQASTDEEVLDTPFRAIPTQLKIDEKLVGCQKSMVPATSRSGWPWVGLTMRRRLLAFLSGGACGLVVRVSGVGPCL